ncbi:MAG: hypothetical protein ACOYM3_29460, partial [Terrimicrobiaceae bacterium]
HPLIQRWAGIRFEGDLVRDRLDLAAVLARTRFGQDQIPNPAAAGDVSDFSRFIGPAVDAMQDEIRGARQAFEQGVKPELERQLARLSAFRDARNSQLELRFEKNEHVRDAEKRKVGDLYEQYKKWIRDTLETEDQPYIRVAAIFTHAN